MGAMAIVQAEVNVEVERRATEVLQREGMTIADAVREMLTRTADEGMYPLAETAGDGVYGDDDPEYTAWFCAKVDESLIDPRPAISREELDKRMAPRRAAALAQLR